MSTFTAAHPDLVDPLPKEVYFQTLDQQEELFSKLFNMKTSRRAYEDAMKVSGLSLLVGKAEGAPVSYDDPVSGARKRLVHSTYALGFRITMEMQQDDQFDIMSKMPGDMARSTRDHQENLAWSVIINGGSGTNGLDGLSLFSTAHTYLKSQGTSSSSTQSNDLSPAVALSVTGLESIMNAATSTRDDSGRFSPTMNILKWLVIPPGLQFEAARILESQFEPFTSDNQINTMRSSRTGIQPMVVPYLTSSTNWFVFADKANHSLEFYTRMEPTMESGRDFDTKDSKYTTCWRGVAGFRNWWGAYRSAA